MINKNMFSCKVFLLFIVAGLDSSSEGASLSQNWGDGFNIKQQSQLPAVASQNVNKQSPPPQYVQQISPDPLKIFDTELLKHVAKNNPGNFMVSPASVKAVLAMLLEGAKGSCAEELKTILRLPNDQNQVRNHFKAFMESLNTRSKGIILESANQIFLSNAYTPNNNYVNVLKQYYRAEPNSVDFFNPETITYMNRLVNASTHGLIPYAFGSGEVAPDSIMILTNILYFKGLWENAFNSKLTKPKCFKVDNTCRIVDMMEVKNDFKFGHIENLHSQAIEIPYKGGKYSMVILLPNDVNGMNSLVTGLPYFPLPTILENMEEREVELSMPKFSIDFSQDLISVLQQLGIQEVFNSNADLFGIIAEGVKSPQVNSVIHKTRIEVNELGSTAAAITGAMVVPLMGSFSEKMNIDHPFLFFIRDVTTGTILFQGRVSHPKEVSLPSPKPTVKQNIPSQISFPQPKQEQTSSRPAEIQREVSNYQPAKIQPAYSNVRPANQEPTYSNSRTNQESQYSNVRTNQEAAYSNVRNNPEPAYSNVRTNPEPTYSNVRTNQEQTYSNVRTNPEPAYSNVRTNQEPKYSNVRNNQEATLSNVRTNPEPIFSNVRTNQDFDVRNQPSLRQPGYTINFDQQRQTNTGFKDALQSKITFDPYSQNGKQQSTGLNTQALSSQIPSNPKAKNSQNDVSYYALNSPSNSIQIPLQVPQLPVIPQSFINANSFSPVYDGNQLRENKVSNIAFILQKNSQGDSIEPVNNFSKRTAPNRMDAMYQPPIPRDKDAILFRM